MNPIKSPPNDPGSFSPVIMVKMIRYMVPGAWGFLFSIWRIPICLQAIVPYILGMYRYSILKSPHCQHYRGPARPGACRRFERGAGSFLYSGPVGIWKRSGATRKQCLGGREAQWPGMKKNITRLLFRRAFFTQKGSSTCGAIKSCAMTTRGRTAVPRGLLRVLGTLACRF